jgi:hypothetical protein
VGVLQPRRHLVIPRSSRSAWRAWLRTRRLWPGCAGSGQCRRRRILFAPVWDRRVRAHRFFGGSPRAGPGGGTHPSPARAGKGLPSLARRARRWIRLHPRVPAHYHTPRSSFSICTCCSSTS